MARRGRRVASSVAALFAAAVLGGACFGGAHFAAFAAAHDAVRIETASDDPGDRRAAAQLRRSLAEYDVERWIYTREVRIERGAIPHSHPVLTLNAIDREAPAQLATFLHEQFHWYLETRQTDVAGAVADFARLFPDAPVGGSAGARDRESTYEHLIVCDLELQAMIELVGERRARDILGHWDHYTWVYRQVLGNQEIRRINARHGLLLPAAGTAMRERRTAR